METKDNSKWEPRPSFSALRAGVSGEMTGCWLCKAAAGIETQAWPYAVWEAAPHPRSLVGVRTSSGPKRQLKNPGGTKKHGRKEQVCHLTPHTTTSGCRVPEDLCQETK